MQTPLIIWVRFVKTPSCFLALEHRNTRFPVENGVFPSLAGAIIWVRFEKHTQMIDGENNRPATGRFIEPDRGQGEVRPPHPEAIHGLHGLHGPASGMRRPVSGETPSARMTAVFMAGRRLGIFLYHVKRNLLYFLRRPNWRPGLVGRGVPPSRCGTGKQWRGSAGRACLKRLHEGPCDGEWRHGVAEQ